jgi:ATP-binding cassette subfamily C (CFTR/MRP) protein 1
VSGGSADASAGLSHAAERGTAAAAPRHPGSTASDSTASGSRTTSAAASATAAAGAASGPARGKLTQREERARGRAKLRIYTIYLRAFGSTGFLCWWLTLVVGAAALGPLQSIALKSWLDDMYTAPPPAEAGLQLYLLAAGGFALATIGRVLTLPFGSIRASRRLHAGMACNVLRAQLSWFQATPVGRILNRFSSDIAAIDSELAGNLSERSQGGAQHDRRRRSLLVRGA